LVRLLELEDMLDELIPLIDRIVAHAGGLDFIRTSIPFNFKTQRYLYRSNKKEFRMCLAQIEFTSI
jgi:hypothetical protein